MVTAVVLGLLVGVVIGGLGGGGGVLTVPLLVYLLGQSARHATTGSVIIVGVAAAAGAVARIRGGGIDWRTGIAFGLLGLPAAYLGTVANRHVAEPVLMLVFAALTLLAAAAMLRDGRGSGSADAERGLARDPAPGAGGPVGGTGTAVATRPERPGLRIIDGTVVGCAAAVGFLTGFLGVGGGFLVVPVLVLVLRMPMATAAGTSLVIILVNSASSVVSRVGALDLDWRVIAPFAAAAALGTLLGRRVADRLRGATLARCFAVVLVVVGLFVAAESLTVL
jgi:uncharacterized membrane protein YfcA